MENKDVILEKPDLPKRLFWEFRYEEMNWREDYVTVIERVIERGNTKEWTEMVRFYGEEKIIHALRNEINYLADTAIHDACTYFRLRKEELSCYIRKQSRPRHWH